jgi:predicted RNA binding protein YcfA (HicA-like mRNA interferase family)
MKAVSGREFARILERHGWTLRRVSGSHHIYGKPGVAAHISVPIHGNQNLKTGMLRHFITVAGLDESALTD